MVMLGEWRAFLKAAKMAAHTKVGQCLNTDEGAGGAHTPAKAPKATVAKAKKPLAAAARPQGAKRMSSSAGGGTAVLFI